MRAAALLVGAAAVVACAGSVDDRRRVGCATDADCAPDAFCLRVWPLAPGGPVVVDRCTRRGPAGQLCETDRWCVAGLHCTAPNSHVGGVCAGGGGAA